MIAVGGVVIGRKHGGEKPAAAVAHLAQERAFGARRGPILQHRHPAAVGEAKAGDVERVGGRMLAECARFRARKSGGS